MALAEQDALLEDRFNRPCPSETGGSQVERVSYALGVDFETLISDVA